MFCRRSFFAVFVLIGGGRAYNNFMVSLSDLKTGEKGRVAWLRLPEDTAARLRILGLRHGKKITLLKRGFFSRSFLIATEDGRVGLRRKTAEKIFLEVLREESEKEADEER